jgi:hypothetical protein
LQSIVGKRHGRHVVGRRYGRVIDRNLIRWGAVRAAPIPFSEYDDS